MSELPVELVGVLPGGRPGQMGELDRAVCVDDRVLDSEGDRNLGVDYCQRLRWSADTHKKMRLCCLCAR